MPTLFCRHGWSLRVRSTASFRRPFWWKLIAAVHVKLGPAAEDRMRTLEAGYGTVLAD